MTPEQNLELAASLAKSLTYVRKGGEVWTVLAKDEQGHGVTVGYGNAQLYVRVRDRRWTVTGVGPEGYGLRHAWRATFALEPEGRWPVWDTLRIAREVDRRIISAGYVDDVLVAQAKKDERDAEDVSRHGWITEAAGLFAIDTDPDEPDKLYLKRFVAGSGYVQAHGVHDTEHLDINLSGIPAQVALDMLAPLAAHAARECTCCRVYGPGHHPMFATVGCLRQRSERGQAASYDRVAKLLGARDGGPEDVYAALDEAIRSDYCVSVIERDGEVLAVVEWDHDGCGEFTVELARPKS